MKLNVSLRVKKVIVGAVMFGLAAKAAAWGCPPVIDSVWLASFVSGLTTLTNGVMGMVQSVNLQEQLNTQREMSALKVQTKQIAASAEKEVANMSQSMQALASTVVAQNQAEQTQKVMEQYGRATGQGFDPCGEQTKGREVTSAYANTHDVVNMVRGSIDAGPGVYKDQKAALSARLGAHKAKFCTQAEVDAGFCSGVGAAPGASLTFATMMSGSNVGDLNEDAKNAFVNHVFGLPDQPLNPAIAETPEAQAYVRDKMKRDGIRSIAATSFKTIQAMTHADPSAAPTSTNNNGYVSDQSFVDAMKKKVDQYVGGDNYRVWEQTLAVQSERGLLVNLAKMAAFRLYLTSVEYDQYERMEANLAALLATENRGRVR